MLGTQTKQDNQVDQGKDKLLRSHLRRLDNKLEYSNHIARWKETIVLIWPIGTPIYGRVSIKWYQ